MLKRGAFFWLVLALLATLPVFAYDYHHWRTDGQHVFGSSIRQQSSNQAFNLFDDFSDPAASSYTIFWKNELQNNGNLVPGAFGDLPPTVAIRDNREQDDEIAWDRWKPVQDKGAGVSPVLPSRPLFTPNIPQAWNPIVADLDSSGDVPDHALLAVTFEQMRVPGAVNNNRATRLQDREQVLNLYYPQTANGLPGNDPNVNNPANRGTVRPYWLRGGDQQTPGLLIRDLEPVRNSLTDADDPGVGVVTQPPIFARVPAVYQDSNGRTVAEVLPVVYLVVGTGETSLAGNDFARVICIALQKPVTQPRTVATNALESFPLRASPAPNGEPPDPDYFNPNDGSGGQVMWSYRVRSRIGGLTPTPVAGISFANIGSSSDSRPLLFVTTGDGQVICLNAKAADRRNIDEDGDPRIDPNDPAERWIWRSPTMNPVSGPMAGMPFTPGFHYGMAPAVARVPFAGAFSNVSTDDSVNTVRDALAKGLSEWMVFVADTYGTFWALDAPGHPQTDAMGKLTAYTQANGEERWKDEPGTPAGSSFRLDPQGAAERFIVPPVVYQGNTPLRTSNGSIVGGSSDTGVDDEVIFGSERGCVYSLDCMGEIEVDSMNTAVNGRPTRRTHRRWKFPEEDTTFAGGAAEEPRPWPRQLEDPFNDHFYAGTGARAGDAAGAYLADERVLGRRIDPTTAAYNGLYSRGPLGVSLGINTNPDGSNPNLDPGDDYVYVPYMQEMAANVQQLGVPGAGFTSINRPNGHRWFYEYVGSLKPYGFIQTSRPILQLNRLRVTLNGDTVEIPLNRVQVGTIKSNGLPVNQVPTILAPGAGAGGANPNFDPSGPVPEDTVYFSDVSWYDEGNDQWYEIPLRPAGGNPPIQIEIEYIPPTSASDSSPAAAVTETLEYPSCYRREFPDATAQNPNAPFDPAGATVVRGRASLAAERNRLEQRRVRRPRPANGATPALAALMDEEDPAYVADGDFIINPITGEGARQPAIMASGSASNAGVLMAPSLFRGRVIAFSHRLRTQRILTGSTDPNLFSPNAFPPDQDNDDNYFYGPPIGQTAGPDVNVRARTPDPAYFTYDPGPFHDMDGETGGATAVNDPPFVADEVFAADVGGSVTLLDGWAYVMYRNGHLRGYGNVGGGGAGFFTSYPPLIDQLPGQPNNGTLVEAPVGVYFLTRTAGGAPAPTTRLDDIRTVNGANVTITGSRLGVDVGTLDRSVMVEVGQTLYVAVDYGPTGWLSQNGPQSINPDDNIPEIDPQILLPGNDVQGQIRSSNGAVQQLPGINRGVLPTVMTVPWDVTSTHYVALLQVFAGIPSQSNPLTPGTPALWEREPAGGQFNDFQGELTYDIQVTQQGVQWRWPDDMVTRTSNGNPVPDKQHYWEMERVVNSGGASVRFQNTGGSLAGVPRWSWTNPASEWAPLLTYNNPISVYYDPLPGNASVEGMLGPGGLVNTLTLVPEYTTLTAPGRKNGDPYAPGGGVTGATVAGSRSGSGRPVVPTVGVGVRDGGGTVWAQQLLFGDHGKATPVSTTRYQDVGKLRVGDRSYLGLVNRALPVRVQRAPLTKIGRGADYGARLPNGSPNPALRNLGEPLGGAVGSFEQNIATWDDGPDQLYPSISDSALKVTKLGTSLDLAASPVPVPGRDINRRDVNGGLLTPPELETLGVQVDVPLYTPDDIYATRYRGLDPVSPQRGSGPLTAFNPFFPFPASFGVGSDGRSLWDRAERYSRSPDPQAAEIAALTTRGEDALPPAGYDPRQNDRTRRVVLFVDANGNGQLDLLPTYREAYRTFAVQVVVKPEMKLEAQQTQLDLGNLWHGKRQPGTDNDVNPASNPHLEIREYQRMRAWETSGSPAQQSFAAFWKQYWRGLNVLNTGNVNLAYVKPEVAVQSVGPPATLQITGLPGEGNDPWRTLPFINATSAASLADPLQIFLRTSVDDQFLPTGAAAYGSGVRGFWIQKATVGSGQPSAAAYAEVNPENTGGDPRLRDPSNGGVARELALTLNVPTGAALGTYSGTLRFYNDRAVAFDEEPDHPGGAGTPTIGYRYRQPNGTGPMNGTLERRADGEPLEPVSEPPVGLRARVIENMVHGRSAPDGNGNPVADSPGAQRRSQPAALPDLNSLNAGQVTRIMLAYANNATGLVAGQPGMYDLFGSQLLMDTSRGLFPFDALPLLRQSPVTSMLEPWAEFSSTAAGWSLFTNVTGAGGNTSTTKPSLFQDALDPSLRAVLAWSQRRTLGQQPGVNNEQYGVVLQEMSPTFSPNGAVLIGPGGQLPDFRVQRSSVRTSGWNSGGNFIWMALYATNNGSRRNLTYTVATGDPFAPGSLSSVALPGWPSRLSTTWTPETTLAGTRSLSTVNDPTLYVSYPVPRLPQALPANPADPPYIAGGNENTTLPPMAWVGHTGANQRLGRSDVYLTRHRVAALVQAAARGQADPTSRSEDFALARFPRMEAAIAGNPAVPIGGDLLQADARRTVYTASGANWIVNASPNFSIKFYLVQPDIPAGQPGSATNPVPLIDPVGVPETPEGELVFPLAAAIQAARPELRNFRLLVDKAAGVVRLTADARTLSRVVLRGAATPANPAWPDPLIYADYTPASMRLTRGNVTASDPVIIPVLGDRPNGAAFDASWYRQQLEPAKWNAGIPVAGRADRLYVFWRRAAAAGGSGPAAIYKVMRPGVQVRSTNPDTGRPFIRGILPAELGVTDSGGGAILPEEVNPGIGQVYFPYSHEGQTVIVQYVDFYGRAHREQHVVRWLDETTETVIPMETSVNEGSLDAFPAFEEVQMTVSGGAAQTFRKLERLWMFWSSTRGSAGDLFTATLAPRIGPDINLAGSAVVRSFLPGRPGFSQAGARQAAAQAALNDRRRPVVVVPPVRRGPVALIPGRTPRK